MQQLSCHCNDERSRKYKQLSSQKINYKTIYRNKKPIHASREKRLLRREL